MPPLAKNHPELETALPRTVAGDGSGEEQAVVAIFPAFFRLGILAVLTTGCLLGAVALLGVALRQSYTAAGWLPYILAHANSQLYGWVGFFVMGFALQQHPPRISRVAMYQRFAYLQLWLLVVAILLRFVAEPLATPTASPEMRAAGMTLGIGTAVLQAIAVALFIANIGMTRHRAKDRAGLPWQSYFVFASLGWWFVAAVVEPWVFAATHTADAGANAGFIAAHFVPYREAQFLGFIPQMIFGVALARFSEEFGLRPALRLPGLIGFVLWNGALLARMAGWMVWTGGAVWGLSLYHVGGLLLAVAAFLLVNALGIFARRESNTLSAALWFIRTAFIWLLIAGALMAAEPRVLASLGVPFSHAYTGAIRHALTVGFISQMIVGVALHIVPRWKGYAPAITLSFPLMVTLICLNIGNLARVTLEIATDFTKSAFAPMGMTGFIELIALAFWATYLFRVLRIPNRVTVREAQYTGKGNH